MASIFHELKPAARALGITVEELGDMAELGDLSIISLGESRRLVKVGEVDRILERLDRGGPLRTRRRYTASSEARAVDLAAVEPSQTRKPLSKTGIAPRPGTPRHRELSERPRRLDQVLRTESPTRRTPVSSWMRFWPKKTSPSRFRYSASVRNGSFPAAAVL